MQWTEILQDQSLYDLPYKIELNRWGQIVMSPPSNKHGRYQFKIGWVLSSQIPGGTVITECCIQTDDGVQVPDVVWCSQEFVQKYGDETPFPEAPEICVEVVSPSNTMQQMQAKMMRYFHRGAKECWLVGESGQVRFFVPEGEQQTSIYGVSFAPR